MNWDDWANPNCVAEPRWEEERKQAWDCTTCKKYVKMTHLSKMWSQERAEVQVRRWEGQPSTCRSKHFVHRYDEVTRNAGLRDSKPNVMNYSNMAMVWAEIVLHKDVDWRTIYGKDVNSLNRNDAVVYTSWTAASDCMPEWSNRGQFGFPATVLPDAEDEYDDDDDDDNDDAPAPVTFGERHERQQSREDIEYDQQLQEAMRRSLEDRGRQDRPYGSYHRDRGESHPRDGQSGSQYSNDPRFGSPSVGGSYGTTYYGGSYQGGSQYYSGSTAGGSYGHHGHEGSYQRDHGARDPQDGGGGSYYGNNPQTGSQGVGGGHGTVHYTPPSEGRSHDYSGPTAGGSYGHRGGSSHGGSSRRPSEQSPPVPPPTFGGPYYGNYGQGGAPSGHGDIYGGGPYLGIYGSGSTSRNQRDNTDSDSE